MRFGKITWTIHEIFYVHTAYMFCGAVFVRVFQKRTYTCRFKAYVSYIRQLLEARARHAQSSIRNDFVTRNNWLDMHINSFEIMKKSKLILNLYSNAAHRIRKKSWGSCYERNQNTSFTPERKPARLIYINQQSFGQQSTKTFHE